MKRKLPQSWIPCRHDEFIWRSLAQIEDIATKKEAELSKIKEIGEAHLNYFRTVSKAAWINFYENVAQIVETFRKRPKEMKMAISGAVILTKSTINKAALKVTQIIEIGKMTGQDSKEALAQTKFLSDQNGPGTVH